MHKSPDQRQGVNGTSPPQQNNERRGIKSKACPSAALVSSTDFYDSMQEHALDGKIGI